MHDLSRRFICIAAAVGLAACGGDAPAVGGEGALSEELQRDLALAAGEGVELAAPAGGHEPTRFMSAVEAGPAPTPVSPTPKRRPSRRPSPRPAPAPAPVEATEEVVAEAPVPEPEPQQAEAVAEAEAPVVAVPAGAGEGDRAVGVDARGTGAGDDRGGRRGGGIGTIIGVVLRGGGVDGDHCERHDRRRGRGVPPVLGGPIIGGIGIGGGRVTINDRIPSRGPRIGQSTFPRF